MADVAFHFNVPDKLAYACRLLRKAHRHGAAVAVVAADDVLQRLDEMLWDLEPTDFVPHCRADAEPVLLAHSPLLLTADPRGCAHRDVLVNLGDALPHGFADFGRVVEVVSEGDEADRAHARRRWRQYAEAGHAIVRYDVASSEGS